MRRRMRAPTTEPLDQNIHFAVSTALRVRIQQLARQRGEKEGATVRRLVVQALDAEAHADKEHAA